MKSIERMRAKLRAMSSENLKRTYNRAEHLISRWQTFETNKRLVSVRRECWTELDNRCQEAQAANEI